MEKKRKKAIIGVLGVLAGAVICKYIGHEINKDGSSLWFKYASLDELEKYREEVGEKFRNAGLNNLSDQEYCQVERMKFKLDNYIGKIKNTIFEKEHPNVHLPHREDGWYLLNKD